MARPIGPKGAKSASLSLRLTPKARYGLTLLARLNRLSLGEVVEEALECAFYGDRPEALKNRLSVNIGPSHVLDATWDVLPWVRFGKLALLAPDMLTQPEKRLWRKIFDTKEYWLPLFWDRITDGLPESLPDGLRDALPEALVHEALKADWEHLSLEYEVGT